MFSLNDIAGHGIDFTLCLADAEVSQFLMLIYECPCGVWALLIFCMSPVLDFSSILWTPGQIAILMGIGF